MDRLERYLLQILSFWLQAEEEALKGLITPSILTLMEELLLENRSSSFQKGIRKLVSPLLKRTPPKLRYSVTTILKEIRSLKGMRSEGIGQCRLVQIIESLKNRMGIEKYLWDGKRSALCMTHDVDYLVGYRNLLKIAMLDKKYGIKSTFNLLVYGDYKLEESLLSELTDMGQNIGLHGYDHDIAFGYRPKSHIEDRLRTAMKELPVKVSGYRAPAFCFSRNLIEVLNDLGFKYDTSLPVTNGPYYGIEVCFPYRYPFLKIWEIPLTIDDTFLFRDYRLSEKEALRASKRIIADVNAVGGLTVINTHPSIIIRNLNFYEELLGYLKEQDNIRLESMESLVNYLEEKQQNTVKPLVLETENSRDLL